MRSRMCWARSSSSTEWSPSTGRRISLPAPASSLSGDPVKTSRTRSGCPSLTHGADSPAMRIVNTSPNCRCARSTKGTGRVNHASVWMACGRRGPGGSWELMYRTDPHTVRYVNYEASR